MGRRDRTFLAVKCNHDLGWGMNLGVLVGYDLMIRSSRKGRAVEVGVVTRATWIKKTETLVDSGEQSVQRHQWLDLMLLTSIGFASWH